MAEKPTNPNVSLTKSEVVKRFAVSRVTLDKYIKNGKISAEKGERIGDGEPAKYEWHINLAEAKRVLTERTDKKASSASKKSSKGSADATEVALLQQKVEHLEAMLREKDERIRDATSHADEWKQQFEKQTALLEDQRTKAGELDRELTREKSKGVWQKLIGG